MASKTLWVEAGKKDRSVALSEVDELHPDGEAWVVGYPNERNPVEVGRTPLVQQKLISGELVEVEAPAKPDRATARTGASRAADDKPPA
jgi:hypothetical protein